MRSNETIRPALLAVLVITVLGLAMTGCNRGSFTSLPHVELPERPMDVTVDQLSNAYIADEFASDVEYKGKRLLFTNIEVEKVCGKTYTDRHGDAVFVNEYFITGSIKFLLRDFGIMQNIKEGYVLNVVGECYGLVQGFVYMEDCWVEAVVGDLGGDVEIDFY